MKKIFSCIVIITLLLCGCQSTEDTNDYLNNISKTQEISVVAPDTLNVIETITDKEDIEKFISAMDLAEWTVEKLPEDAKKVGIFILSQEKTVELGQTETDGKLYDVGKIIVYDDSYVSLEIAGVGITFDVTDNTAEYLRKYF